MAVWHQANGRTLTGEAAFAAPITGVRCRERYREMRVRGPAGQTYVSQVQLYLLPSQPVAVGDEFTLATGERLRVIGLGRPQGLDSTAYKFAILGG